MEDLYGTGPSPGSEPEEFSTFCNQILQNSSSSSSPFITKYIQPFSPVVNFSDLEGNQLVTTTTTTTATDDVKESTDNTFSDENTCSKTRGVSFDNDFSCDSEKDGPSNQVRPRCSSKRTRAAEVHNLSEKRRRSRINEKMKALQNLIPNSNKTDKASMLDEAIEYLKQLQLQVQMLSMRNGLSLHPFCLPGMLQPMQLPTGMSFDEGNGLLTTNTGTASFSANAESLTHTAFNISNQCNISNQPIVLPTVTNMATESSFGFEPSLQAQYGPYNLPTSSKEICKEGTPKLQLDTNHTGRNSSSGVP